MCVCVCIRVCVSSPGITTLSWWRGLHGPVIPRAIPSGPTLLIGSPMVERSRGGGSLTTSNPTKTSTAVQAEDYGWPNGSITTAVNADEGCSRKGPPVVLEPMPLDSDPFLSRIVWWLSVHQSPHVKQNHAQNFWETTLTSWSKSYGDQRVATGVGLWDLET